VIRRGEAHDEVGLLKILPGHVQDEGLGPRQGAGRMGRALRQAVQHRLQQIEEGFRFDGACRGHDKVRRPVRVVKEGAGLGRTVG